MFGLRANSFAICSYPCAQFPWTWCAMRNHFTVLVSLKSFWMQLCFRSTPLLASLVPGELANFWCGKKSLMEFEGCFMRGNTAHKFQMGYQFGTKGQKIIGPFSQNFQMLLSVKEPRYNLEASMREDSLHTFFA